MGIDLGGTKIEGRVLAPDGSEVARLRILAPQGDYESTVRALTDIVRDLDAKAGGATTVWAWAVGVCTFIRRGPSRLGPVADGMRSEPVDGDEGQIGDQAAPEGEAHRELPACPRHPVGGEGTQGGHPPHQPVRREGCQQYRGK